MRALAAAVGLVLLLAAPMPVAAQSTEGEALFNQRCKMCHDPATDRAPNRAALASRTPAEIVDSLAKGVMAPMADGLSPTQMQSIADFLTAPGPGRRGPAAPVPTTHDKHCSVHGTITPGPSDWASWGKDSGNSRYQPNPGLGVGDVPKLKVKWAFSIRGGSYGQPTVVGDWLWVTTRAGGLYALDANTGCVHWQQQDATSRTTPMVVRSAQARSGWATYVGVSGRIVKAYDAWDGQLIWTSPALETHRSSNIVGSPMVTRGLVLVPLSSGEEVTSGQPGYACCSFRGSLAALDRGTGKVVWHTSMIADPLRPTRKNSAGVMMQGPAGSAIWSAPTLDEARGLVYVATGDSYTELDHPTADAIVALEIATGKIRWVSQVTSGDNYLTGCNWLKGRGANCPEPTGPDYDFGASPLLHTLPSGKQIILAGQKSGIAYGIDPDSGRQLWRRKVGTGSNLGGIEWGIAADKARLYVPNSDIIVLMDEYLRPRGEAVLTVKPEKSRSGLTAIDPATGKVVWHVAAPKVECHYAGDRSRDRVQGGICFNAQSAAASVMPGVVFSGTLDGWMRAYDARTGKVLWAYSTTAQTYATTNGIKDQPGGSIDSVGPTIAGGHLYVMSGYGGTVGTGGNSLNVLLAFSPDGK